MQLLSFLELNYVSSIHKYHYMIIHISNYDRFTTNSWDPRMNHLEFEKKKQNIQIVSLIVSRGFTKVELHAKASIRREEKKRQNIFAVAFTCSCMFPWTATAEICNPVLLVNSNQLSHLSLHTLQHSTRKKHQNSHVNYPPENDSRTHNHRFSSLFHSFHSFFSRWRVKDVDNFIFFILVIKH